MANSFRFLCFCFSLQPGPSMHSTFFSKSEKPERGDTSTWTDTPLEKAHKAKQQYCPQTFGFLTSICS